MLKRLAPYLLLFAIFAGVARAGVDPADEGFFLHTAETVLHKLPYLEVSEIRTPLSYYLTGAFLAVGGKAIYPLRLLMGLLILVAIAATGRALRVPDRFAFGFVILLGLSSFVHFASPWYSWFAVFFAALALDAYARDRLGRAFAAAFLCFLTKQTPGLAAAGGLILMLVIDRRYRAAATFALGFAGCFAALVGTMALLQRELAARFLYLCFLSPFKTLAGRIAANWFPFILDPMLLAVAALFLLVLLLSRRRGSLPVLGLAIAAGLAAVLLGVTTRQQAFYFMLPVWALLPLLADRSRWQVQHYLFGALFYYSGLFNGFDLVHFVCAAFFLFAFLYREYLALLGGQGAGRLIALPVLILYLVTNTVFVLRSEARRYADWTDLTDYRHPLALPYCGGLLVRPAEKAEYEAVYRYLRDREGALFCYPFDAFFYYALDRPNPTPYAFYLADTYDPANDRAVIGMLRAAGVKYVLLRNGGGRHNAELFAFLQREYQPVLTTKAFQVREAVGP